MSLKRDVSDIIRGLDLEDFMVKALTIKTLKLRRIMMVALRMNRKVFMVFISRRTFHHVRVVGGHIEDNAFKVQGSVLDVDKLVTWLGIVLRRGANLLATKLMIVRGRSLELRVMFWR